MNSHHISRSKKLRRIAFIGVIFIVLIFAVPKFVASIASAVFTPIYKVNTWLAQSSDSFPMYFRDRSLLIEEITTLKTSQLSQGADQLILRLLTEENRLLRQLSGDKDEKRILAGVIGRPNMMPYDVLVLDKGSYDGIVEGAPVFVAGNVVVGIVRRALFDSSIVELVTTPGFKVSVYILGPDIFTNAVGIGGGQLQIGVPQGIKLTKGDLVILPGVHSGVYGEISVIESTPTQPEQYGYVSPAIPLTGFNLVSVGVTPLEPVSFDEAKQIVLDVKNNVFEVPVPDHVLITTHSTTTTATSSDSLP